MFRMTSPQVVEYDGISRVPVRHDYPHLRLVLCFSATNDPTNHIVARVKLCSSAGRRFIGVRLRQWELPFGGLLVRMPCNNLSKADVAWHVSQSGCVYEKLGL